MARHEFGIMQFSPEKGKRYDEYEPQKYNCISVDDEHIELIINKIAAMHTFCHTLDNSYKGLVYCGITIIPPTSLDLLISAIESIPEAEELKKLLLSAKQKNKYVIHYGL